MLNNKYTNYQLPITKLLFALFFIFPFGISAQTIKIASYNVENLFDMRKDGTEYVEYIPGHHGWDQRMLDIKLRNLTEVICDLEADVIGLQEVENDDILSQLQRSLERAGCKYRYRAITSSKNTPIHNAVLSKISIKKKRDVLVGRYGRRRSMLEVVLKTDTPLRVFVNHWKSKRGPESERIPYAKALMKRISSLPKGAEYVLIGDFNSNYNESTTIDNKHNDTGNVTGINNILKTTRSDRRMVRLGDVRDGEHVNLWMDVDAGSRWSHNFFGSKEGLDAIIIPKTLHDGKKWEYVAGTCAAFKPKYLFGYHGRVNRWGYKHSKHLGKGYSDHLPVYAVFGNGGEAGVETVSMEEESWWHKLIGIFLTPQDESDPKPVKSQNMPTKPAVEIEISDISKIKSIEKINKPVRLEGVCVVLKRGDSAVIMQKPSGEAILLYRSALQLEEGKRYDIIAHKKKRYKGLDELTDIEVERDLGEMDTSSYVRDFNPKMMEDEKYINTVVKNITGVIKGYKIYIENQPYPIHLKKRAGRPPKGTIVVIKRAQIGYYKDHIELVIWSKKDYNY